MQILFEIGRILFIVFLVLGLFGGTFGLLWLLHYAASPLPNNDECSAKRKT